MIRCLALASAAAALASASAHEQSEEFLTVRVTPDPASSSARAPHGERIAVQMGDEHVELALDPMLVREGAQLRVDGEPAREARTVVYAGRTRQGAHVRAAMLDDRGSASLALLHGGELRLVEPVAQHPERTQERAAARGATHVSFRHADAAPEQRGSAWHFVEALAAKGLTASATTDKVAAPVQSMRRQPLQYDMYADSAYIDYNGEYGLLSGCPSSLYIADYGFAHDLGYGRQVSGSTSVDVDLVEAVTQQMMAITNMLYTDQVNLFIRIADLDVRTSSGGPDWNQNPSDPGDKTCDVGTDTGLLLDYLTDYYADTFHPADTTMDGLHLLTNCFPAPGTVGLAYVSATGSSSYATGWTSWGSATYETLAHELGHNIGASHAVDGSGNVISTDGGLMSYDSSAEFYFKNEVSSPTDVCDHISSVVAAGKLDAAYSDCGNGVMEPGEECDDSTACCDASCRLVAQCSPAENECCQSDCFFEPTTTLCADANGFCANGVCTGGNYCGYYSNTGCCSRSDNLCSESTTYDGDDTCYDSGEDIAAGVVCSTGDMYGECDGSGTCVEALDVVQPAAGTTWGVAEEATVSWAASFSDSSTVTITLSDGTVLATATPNDGVFTFAVPTSLAEGTYTVTVSVDDSSSTTTSNSFTIASSTCTNGVQDDDEDGVDCGGVCGASCGGGDDDSGGPSSAAVVAIVVVVVIGVVGGVVYVKRNNGSKAGSGSGGGMMSVAMPSLSIPTRTTGGGGGRGPPPPVPAARAPPPSFQPTPAGGGGGGVSALRSKFERA